MTGRTEKGARGTPRLRRDGGSGGAGGWDNLPPSNPPPTGEEFDALTDLFLGEVGTVGNDIAPRSNSDATVAAGNRAAGPSRPVLRLAGAEDELELDEPAPAPAPAAAAPSEPTRDEPTVEAEPATSAIVECIVLGHLPVLAAAWGAQYVREIAQASGGPVAYLRLQHGYASIELIGGDGSTAALPSAKSLEQGVRLAAERTRRWVVRADAGDEAVLAASPLVRVVTLLTGVDEAAVVAAYGSVKSLAKSLSGSSGPILRVAAMGAAPEKAMPAGKRLAEAITRFVGREVDTAVCSARIASARPSEVLFTGRTDILPGAAMELLGRIADETEVIERPAAERVAAAALPALVREEAKEVAAPVARQLLRRMEQEIEAEPLDDEAETERGEAQAAAPAREEPVAERVTAPAFEPVPRTVTAPPMREAAPVRETAAAARVEERPSVRHAVPTHHEDLERAEMLDVAPSALALLLPGLRPVSIRCPYAVGIEFAVDRAGTVHLLSRIEDGAAEERALSELLVAGAWADAHASMLASSLGQSAALAASGLGSHAELHLFTDRPKASRRLLETSVNVHLLARVEIAGQSGWYCTDLN